MRVVLALQLAGLVFYLGFYLLDLVMYPEFSGKLLRIRLLVGAFNIVIFLSLLRWPAPFLTIRVWAYLLACAIGITSMCVVVGEGFASPYYAGIFLVLMGSWCFSRCPRVVFSVIVASALIQHFLILLAYPYELQDLMKNLFFLCSTAAITVLIQVTLARHVDRIQNLEGILPICASCKMIREDNGHWTQVESYVRDRSDADFTHGVCPDCSMKLYGFVAEEEEDVA